MSATDVRLADAGQRVFADPVRRQAPTIAGWQHKVDASPAEMALWSGTNTGVLTAYTPAIDIDITDPEAAALAEEVAKELFGDRGRDSGALRALAQARAAVPHRDAVPEDVGLLRGAQRHAAQGRDPWRTGSSSSASASTPTPSEPYTWHGRHALDTPREELAEVTEEDVQAYLELVSERLAEECGFRRILHQRPRRRADAGPVDVDERLESMRFGGAGDNAIHPTQLVTASLLRSGRRLRRDRPHRPRRPPRRRSPATRAPASGTGSRS